MCLKGFLGIMCMGVAALGSVHANHDLQHMVHNHEEEIRMLEAKCYSQEEMIADLERRLKGNQQQGILTKQVSQLAKEIQQLRDYADKMAKLVTQLQKELIQEREKTKSLHEAMATLLEAMEVPLNTSTYLVKSGDSLGKIAQNNHTTVAQLKKINQLTSDTIQVGQPLKLPS